MAEAHPLAQFIEAAKAKGAADEFLVRLLRQHGWPEKDIFQAFSIHYQGLTGVEVPRHGSGAEAAKEAFLYLLSFATLATWTIAVGSLFFTLINSWFPDSLAGRSFPSFGPYGISNQLASIIVAFPVYVWVQRLIGREITLHPEKRKSGVRKWLSYLAMFFAASFAIGDVITFLAYLFRGEISVRFVLKVLTVLVIAGGVLWFYLTSLQDDGRDTTEA